MKDLFKEQPKKAVRIARVENLNPEKGISASMKVSMDQRKYTTCLCISNKMVYTTFTNEYSALEQMKKYRQLYKAKKH